MSPRVWLLCALFCISGIAEGLHLGAGINVYSQNLFRNITKGEQNVLVRHETLHVLTDNMFHNSGVHVVRGLPAELDTPEVNGGALRLEFCTSVNNLLRLYYDRYKFEKLNHPWRILANSWSDDTVAAHMGIKTKYVSGNYHYAIVRISRYRVGERLETSSGKLYMKTTVQRQADAIVPRNAESVGKLIQRYGSHYVSGTVTGDSMFQVFVYLPDKLKKVRVILENESKLNNGHLNWSKYDVLICFSPWNVEHNGRILTASGNLAVEKWASSKLVQTGLYIKPYPSMVGSSAQQKIFNLLGNNAILQLELKSIGNTIYNPSKRIWFDQIINSIIMIFESNTSFPRYKDV